MNPPPPTIPPEFYILLTSFLHDAFPALSVLVVAALGVAFGSLVGRLV